METELHQNQPAPSGDGRIHTARPTKKRRSLATLAILVTIRVYLLICLGLFMLQKSLIFYPNNRGGFSPGQVGMVWQPLRLSAVGEDQISAIYIPTKNARGCALVAYGNASNMAEQIGVAGVFQRLGLSVLLFDYPGYGESTGKPSETSLYAAAEAAWMEATGPRGHRPDQIVLFGRSLGGAVMIELAQRHPPAALIVECTFPSLARVGQRQYPFLPVHLLTWHRFDSIRKVPHIHCPKLFLHGVDDELIPLEMARQLFVAAAEPKQWIETPGGHNEAGMEWSYETTESVGQWLNAVLD